MYPCIYVSIYLCIYVSMYLCMCVFVVYSIMGLHMLHRVLLESSVCSPRFQKNLDNSFDMFFPTPQLPTTTLHPPPKKVPHGPRDKGDKESIGFRIRESYAEFCSRNQRALPARALPLTKLLGSELMAVGLGEYPGHAPLASLAHPYNAVWNLHQPAPREPQRRL